jgi:hypothetical protein
MNPLAEPVPLHPGAGWLKENLTRVTDVRNLGTQGRTHHREIR